MTVRTTSKTVTFVNPFVLGDFDEVLPPGAYDVETEEELLDGLSFRAYRRTLALVNLPARSGHRGHSRVLTIDPNELDAALERDEASTKASAERATVEERSTGTPNSHEATTTDRQAADRAEDEGMIARPC